jgi:hypothetical protein
MTNKWEGAGWYCCQCGVKTWNCEHHEDKVGADRICCHLGLKNDGKTVYCMWTNANNKRIHALYGCAFRFYDPGDGFGGAYVFT